ncbi:phage integrase SAM-like domain-containing protein [Bacteroides sp.]|uniref:tyrosine-type recombinase/integrase n=1 Tax=Bacteroides sp. TaxID=29523 RepID=UPI0026104BD5|nr:phage integrase SAM-like domain-containing protein [Bacteroides sp.]MDD3037163.1 phage integrase SAM-like domain-containing protein [Bacteroides sp.]
MAAFKACVKYKRSDGLYTVYIRITQNRKIGYIKTDKISDSPDVNGVFKDVHINKYCANAIAGYAEKLNKSDSKNWTVQEIMAYLNSIDEDICFSEYAKKFTDNMYNRGQERNAKNYYLAIGHLERFIGTNRVMFSQLTRKVIEQWIESLSNTARAKEMYPVCIRQVFRKAMLDLNDEDRDVIRIKSNPFLRIKIPEADMPDKKAVSVDILRAFIKAKLPPTKMLVQSEEIGQDVATLILFLGGISTADLFSLKEEMCDDDTIRYNRCKTKNSRRDSAYCELPIPKDVCSLISKYRAKKGSGYYLNFYEKYSTLDSFNAGANIGIARLCKFHNMERMSSYTFRHSFATICRNELGYSDDDVAFAMNHSSGHRITKGYIREDWSRTTRMCEALYDYIVNGVKIEQKKEVEVDEVKSFRIVSSYKSLIYGTLYYNKKKIGEIADVGFNNIKDVMERMNEFLPEDIPEMARVDVKIENADTGEMRIYNRMVKDGKICVNDHH